jgi:hypothetical protein
LLVDALDHGLNCPRRLARQPTHTEEQRLRQAYLDAGNGLLRKQAIKTAR